MSFYTSDVPSTSVTKQCIEFTASVDPVVSVGTVAVISAPIFVAVLILVVIMTSIVSSLVTYYCCRFKSKAGIKAESDSYSPTNLVFGNDMIQGDASGTYPGGGGIPLTRNGLELNDNMAYDQVTTGRFPETTVNETDLYI
jgi:hypothetical protein